MDKIMADFKITIGLEIHVQLKTKSKMFCSCDNNALDAEPNTLVCPVCLAMPGTLPVANKEAIEMTIKTGLAFGSDILEESKFDRKHYFYPDLPKGYQISQYDKPLCKGGEIGVDGKIIKLNRIHLEEDAGKLTHPVGGNYSLVDLNRAGTPLMEIVTEPDIDSPSQAKIFLQELQLALRYLRVSDADMEKGNLRCDANISISRKSPVSPGASRGGKVESLKSQMSPIVEIKNLNSFKFVEQALSYEAKRLSDDYSNWKEKRVKITRGFDSKKGVTFEQRHKEEAADYRYFPEPDIPPIRIGKKYVDQIKSEMIELPKNKKERYIEAGIRPDVADKIIVNPNISEYLETSDMLKKDLAHFISEEVNSAIAKSKITFAEYKKRVPITAVADLLNLVGSGMVSKTASKSIFLKMVESGKSSKEIIEHSGSSQISDSDELNTRVAETVRDNPELIEKYRAGKTQVLGFLIGDIMKKTNGRANPQLLNKLLKEYLNGNNN
jgi:aspartyl-tRNA(Asn)/glutamyl-tRNA(Gln) amidotransferase subunit B